MRITVDRDPEYAPCSYLICKVDSDDNWDTRNESETVLIQTDWDFPSIASTLGWSPAMVQRDRSYRVVCPCPHDGTDGTVDCKECGVKAGDFIFDAQDYLDAHLGDIVDDPGYFAN